MESVEQWARDYIAADSIDAKLRPPPVPSAFEANPRPVRIEGPGRGRDFRIATKGVRSTGKNALRSQERRADLVHAFFHHELQAAELFAWAVLAFPETPVAFRRGLLGILSDEIRHMRLYAAYLEERGFDLRAFWSRDWFWERIPSVTSPAAFCATLGMGLEAANLDHAARFAARFEAAGDAAAAEIERVVGKEEIPHVLFATRWFERFTGAAPATFDVWSSHLPPPLSPLLMRGDPMDRDARVRAGTSPEFLAELAAWSAA
ncbi:MAG: DUF455 family protein [Polyangiaceae bacterium]